MDGKSPELDRLPSGLQLSHTSAHTCGSGITLIARYRYWYKTFKIHRVGSIYIYIYAHIRTSRRHVILNSTCKVHMHLVLQCGTLGVTCLGQSSLRLFLTAGEIESKRLANVLYVKLDACMRMLFVCVF